MKKIPSIKDIRVFETNGEWPAKSGGVLSVLYKLDFETTTYLMTYDPDELAKIPADIRGLRSYTVRGIARGSVGANEWHKVRNEVVFCTSGSFRWICTDTYGDTKEFVINKDTAILTPHHILHTYVALEDDSTIAVLANTLFYPDNPLTHDTYPSADFPS